MALNIQTNVVSLEAARNVTRSQSTLEGNFRKLSSGLRISRAADDAAGLAISESMKARIQSITVAERNANGGISLAQTAEGALVQQQDVLTRVRELATQASNVALSEGDRKYLNSESANLLHTLDSIAETTQFNGTNLLGERASGVTLSFQVGASNTENDRVAVKLASSTTRSLGLEGSEIATVEGAQAMLGAVDSAIGAISEQRAAMGTVTNKLNQATHELQTQRLSVSSASSRIRDVDVAEESAALARNQVLSQAGVAVLAQANNLPQLALSLLDG
jgi:flagellin